MFEKELSFFISHQAELVCSDESTLTFDEIEELLKLDNPRQRRIRSLSFDGNTYSESESFDLELKPQWNGKSSDLRIESRDDKTAKLLAETVVQTLEETKPWWSWIGRPAPRFTIEAMAVSWGFAVAQPANMWWGVIVGVLFVFVDHMAAQLQQFFFPSLVFRIGRQDEEYAVDENIRFAVSIGLALGVLASLVANNLR